MYSIIEYENQSPEEFSVLADNVSLVEGYKFVKEQPGEFFNSEESSRDLEEFDQAEVIALVKETSTFPLHKRYRRICSNEKPVINLD